MLGHHEHQLLEGEEAGAAQLAAGRREMAGLRGSFQQVFAEAYQRNNKKTGQKNLRCFPQCSAGGHRKSGFCGTPVKCAVAGLGQGERCMRAWAEITTMEEEGELRLGQRMTLDEAQGRERRHDRPALPWLRGEVSMQADEGATIVFNRQLVGWHYAWVSTKHKSNTEHCIRAYLFLQEPGSSEIEFVGCVKSPGFLIHSRRRMQRSEVAIELGPGSSTAAEPCPKRELEEIQVHPLSSKRQRPVGLCRDKETALAPLKPCKAAAAAAAIRPLSAEIDQNRTLDRLMVLATRAPASYEPYSEQDHRPAAPAAACSAPAGGPVSVDSFQSFFDELDANFFELDTGNTARQEYSAPPAEANTPRKRPECPFGRLRAAMLASPDEEVRMQADSVLSAIQAIAQIVVPLCKDSADMKALFDKYSGPEGIARLKAQVAREKEAQGPWSLEREYETFNEHDRTACREDSLFAEMRHVHRKLVSRALQSLCMDISMFHKPMHVAAEHGVVSPDPEFPPDTTIVAMMHIHLYGTLDGLASQPYAASTSGTFASTGDQEAYAKELLLMKRVMCRRMMCHRVVQDVKIDHAVSNMERNERPAPVAWDCSGTWLASPEDLERRVCAIRAVLESVTNRAVGAFLSRAVIGEIFSRTKLKVTESSLVVSEGSPSPMMRRAAISLQGKVTEIHVTPVMAIGPVSRTVSRNVVGWFDRGKNGSHVICVVMAGDAKVINAIFRLNKLRGLHRGKTKEELVDIARSLREAQLAGAPEDIVCPSMEDITAFFMAHAPPGGKALLPELRGMRKIIMPPGPSKRTITFVDRCFLFPSAELAPSLQDTESLAQIERNPNCLQIIHSSVKLTRCVAEHSTEAELLDLADL